MNNREVMERFGYRICASCNADMPADKFVGDRCEHCKESAYDRIRRGIDEHDTWKKGEEP